MKESKVVSSLREAIRLSGLQDGMCVSFHHHLRNGDYVPDGLGGFQRQSGSEALLSRALYLLTARRGAFPFLPELGSELYRLGHEKPSARAAAAKLYTAAALAEETALTVEDVELTERGDGVMALRVLLMADGESAALEMTVRGA